MDGKGLVFNYKLSFNVYVTRSLIQAATLFNVNVWYFRVQFTGAATRGQCRPVSGLRQKTVILLSNSKSGVFKLLTLENFRTLCE